MRGKRLIHAMAIGAAAVGVCGFAPADVPATGPATAGLHALSDASRALHKRVFGGLVRVHIDQPNLEALLPQDLREQFAAWRVANEPSRPGGRGEGAGRRGGGAGGAAGGGGTTQPGGATGSGGGAAGFGGRGAGAGGAGAGFGGLGGQGGQIVQFLQQTAAKVDKTDETQAEKLRGLALRVEMNRNAATGDLLALVFNDQGYAILLTGIIREMHTEPFKVTTPDGTETDAKVIGSNLASAYTIIKLDKLGGATPVSWEKEAMEPGDLLMGISGSQPAVSWTSATARVGQSSIGDRFPIPMVDDRSGIFLFDVDGELAAVGWDRMAVTVSRLQRDVDYIVKNGKDVEPRSLGVAYDPVRPDTRNSLRLGNRSAVVVTDVTAGSLADKAGVKKGDIILAIDGRSIQQVYQIQADLATQSDEAEIDIIRAGKEQTLRMPLD